MFLSVLSILTSLAPAFSPKAGLSLHWYRVGRRLFSKYPPIIMTSWIWACVTNRNINQRGLMCLEWTGYPAQAHTLVGKMDLESRIFKNFPFYLFFPLKSLCVTNRRVSMCLNILLAHKK